MKDAARGLWWAGLKVAEAVVRKKGEADVLIFVRVVSPGPCALQTRQHRSRLRQRLCLEVEELVVEGS